MFYDSQTADLRVNNVVNDYLNTTGTKILKLPFLAVQLKKYWYNITGSNNLSSDTNLTNKTILWDISLLNSSGLSNYYDKRLVYNKNEIQNKYYDITGTQLQRVAVVYDNTNLTGF